MSWSPNAQSSSRPSTPRLYSPARSSSRTHLPAPKVLPFPDIPVRTSLSMSRENSRGPSPLTSPALNTTLSHTDGLLAPSTILAAGPRDARESRRDSRPMAHSASPTSPSPLGGGSTSPPPSSRPRAATATTPSTLALHPMLTRQEGFQPEPRISTPLPAAPSPVVHVMALPPLLSSPPSRPASIPHDPTPTPREREASRPPVPVKKLSNPLGPLPASVVVTPSPPPGALVDHLYRSFKDGTCADMRLWVRKWGVGWNVHKMVLVQAGFFHSLFLGGFSETVSAERNRKGKAKAVSADDDDWAGEEVEIVFDDPNITRAAFEICLSRLYSPYPQLQFPVSLLPTASQPLTPSFPPPSSLPDLRTTHLGLHNNSHLVTPRLLLSLLATTTYLGQQYLLREVIAIVLRSVGPATVGRYLDFAIGNGIGEEEWEGQDSEGAHGMESIAKSVSSIRDDQSDSLDADGGKGWASDPEVDTVGAHLSNPSSHRPSTESITDHVSKVGDSSVSRTASVHSNNTIGSRAGTATVLAITTVGDRSPPIPAQTLQHFYGFVSDKIGEACVCWLARWGQDVLNIESAIAHQKEGPRIWGHGGIPANFVHAILSSDTLFVANEMERYRIARRVLDMRRAGWEARLAECHPSAFEMEGNLEAWEEDERELGKVFADGIYYSHMTFDDLSSISSDIDFTTALPYCPLSVLQAAHWSAADLKSRIMSHESTAAGHENGELGLTKMTSEISSVVTRRRVPRSRVSSPGWGLNTHPTFSSLTTTSEGTATLSDSVYHPIPSDDTHRVGAGGLLFFNSAAPASHLPGIPGMPDLGPEWGDFEGSNRGGKLRPPPHSEKTFFGVLRGSLTSAEIEAKWRDTGGISSSSLGIRDENMDKIKEDRWSKAEPFRFSVEFWGVDKLAEKERLYSATHFYAGSYFNVYVSTVRKKDKGVQLGIYLHRQSTSEPFPPVCASPLALTMSSSAGTQSSTEPISIPQHPTSASTGAFSPSVRPPIYRTISTSPVALGSPPSHNENLPRHDSSSPDVKAKDGDSNYLDPRRVTKAYFSISCASALGTALVRFSSAPDSFALSQSWGWKSSALRSEEYLSVPAPLPQGASQETLVDGVLGWVGEGSEGGSLRATVVVGVI